MMKTVIKVSREEEDLEEEQFSIAKILHKMMYQMMKTTNFQKFKKGSQEENFKEIEEFQDRAKTLTVFKIIRKQIIYPMMSHSQNQATV